MKKILFCLLLLFGSTGFALEKPGNSVNGYYCWPHYPDGILKISLARFKDPGYRATFWDQHRDLVKSGKRRFTVLELIFEYPLKGSRLPALDSAIPQLDAFFEGGSPEQVYAIVPSEENDATGAQLAIMNGIYDYVKEKWNVPVFQWLSEPLLPRHGLRNDGWIFDAYGMKDEAFYRHLLKFVLCGKPVFPVLWASEPGFSGYYKDGIEKIKQEVGLQIDYCTGLNLPVILFAVAGKQGSVGLWMKSEANALPELRRFFAEKLNERAGGMPVYKLSQPAVPVALTDGAAHFEQAANDFRLVDYCNIEHPLQAIIDSDGLRLDGAVLQWRFSSQDKLEKAAFFADFTGSELKLAYSTTGSNWREVVLTQGKKQAELDLNGASDLFLRIGGYGIMLQRFKLNFTGEGTLEKYVAIPADGHLKEDFRSNRFQATVTGDDMGLLQIVPGRAGLPGKKGYPVKWEGRQKFQLAGPVKKIMVRASLWSDSKNWASTAEIAITPSGDSPEWKTLASDKARGPVSLELNGAVQEFFLHYRLRNSSGVYRENLTPAALLGYEINAE
jgi:hypothetical protein